MPNTYSQIYLQFVFAVKHRQSLIPREHKEELHKYITGVVQNRKAKMIAVHCMPDHAHLFVGFKPVLSISDFVKEVKIRIELICTDPHRYRNNYRNFYEISLREFPFYIIYFVDEEKKLVVIASVYHHKRGTKRKYKKKT